MNTFDVVVVGSGIVGATAALSLTRKTSLNIAVLEANPVSFEWKKNIFDHRVSAISLASQKIFKNLRVWDLISQKRISPYKKMHVWDNNAEIHFDCDELNEPVLGFIVEDNVMRASLFEETRKCSNIHLLFPHKLISLKENSDHIELVTEDNKIIKTKLLIAADGANSLVRELLNTKLKTRDYGHTAIVATVHTELSHQQTARQRFLATGPLAFLPLNDANACSIVWSTSHEHAKELLALSDEEFCVSLGDAFKNKLGVITKTEKRYHFPLRMRHAKNYVQSRVALIGDAAHTIHPLAGQGANLGLLDAVCLAEVVIDALKKNRDYASFETLRRYERWRKSDNLAMLAGMDVIKNIFASNNSLIQQARTFGVNLANRNLFLKKFFANYALGKRSDLPMMTR